MAELISLDRIVEIENYRSEYPADHIAGLADSMRANGFKPEYAITAIAIDAMSLKTRESMFGIVTGHCRTRAAMLAGLTAIPVIVKTADSKANALDQLGENENRRDPSDIDRANGYRRALDTGATMAELCASIGKNSDYVNRRLELLALIPEVQALVASKNLPITAANAMVGLNINFQHIALQTYNESELSVKEFKAFCAECLGKQNQLSLDDLPMFGGPLVSYAALMEKCQIVRPKSRAQLERELADTITARTLDRDNAKANFARAQASAQAQIAQLKAQYSQLENAVIAAGWTKIA